MEEFITLTKLLRDEIIEQYRTLHNNFYTKKEIEDEFDESFDDEINNEIDEVIDDEADDEIDDEVEYNKIFLTIIEYIKSNKYKNILYLIVFNDVYEYLKVKQICNIDMYPYEKDLLNFLETFNNNELINKANTSIIFFMDIIKLFTNYQIIFTKEEIEKNKKILELSNNLEYNDKYKISFLDNIQKQYSKTRKIY